MKEISKIISLVLFVALIFVKVSSFHVYAHIGDDNHTAIENCSSCELAIEQQQDHFIVPLLLNHDNPNIAVNEANLIAIYDTIILQTVSYDFYSRPPPSTI